MNTEYSNLYFISFLLLLLLCPLLLLVFVSLYGSREEFPSNTPQNHRQLKQCIFFFCLRAYLLCVLYTFTHIASHPPTHTGIKTQYTYTPTHFYMCKQRHKGTFSVVHFHLAMALMGLFMEYRITESHPSLGCQLIGHSPLCQSNIGFSLLLNATVRLAASVCA